MARKERYVTIPIEGRDKGKVFFIKEMSASQVEEWAYRIYQPMLRAGMEVPENTGMAGVAAVGLKALSAIPYFEAFELMKEMFSCVRIVRNQAQPELAQPLMEEDIEEVTTRLFLRAEVFELHPGFSLAGLKQKLISDPAKTTTQE